MDHTVKQGRFEGPYTKLLSLIEERKLSITEINLGSLADDYILYIRTQEEKDHMDISAFIVVASTLMLMKVKSLLPKKDYTSVEEKQIDDLTYKLLLFAFLEEKTKGIKSFFKRKKVFFSYGKMRLKKREGGMPKNLTKDTLLASGDLLLARGKGQGVLREVAIKSKTSLEEISHLMRTMESDSFSLREISNKVEDDKALILSFISLLELMRHGEFTALQETASDIFITKSIMLN
jgi:segregation and condensation protein A